MRSIVHMLTNEKLIYFNGKRERSTARLLCTLLVPSCKINLFQMKVYHKTVLWLFVMLAILILTRYCNSIKSYFAYLIRINVRLLYSNLKVFISNLIRYSIRT